MATYCGLSKLLNYWSIDNILVIKCWSETSSIISPSLGPTASLAMSPIDKKMTIMIQLLLSLLQKTTRKFNQSSPNILQHGRDQPLSHCCIWLKSKIIISCLSMPWERLPKLPRLIKWMFLKSHHSILCLIEKELASFISKFVVLPLANSEDLKISLKPAKNIWELKMVKLHLIICLQFNKYNA